MMESSPNKISYILFLALIIISMLIACEGCTKDDSVSIIISDKYNTPSYRFLISPSSNLKVPIYAARADKNGKAKFDLKIDRVVGLTVVVQHEDGTSESVAQISINELNNALKYQKIISRKISLIPTRKKIIFTSPKIEGIQIYGINGSNQKELLGTTNSAGKSEFFIFHKDFKRITFSYRLVGARVYTDDGINQYKYENIPSTRSLRAIPLHDINYEFDCISSDSKEGIAGVLVTSSDSLFSGTTSILGKLDLKITPNEESGPFIGESINWLFQSPDYVVLDKVVTTISTRTPDTVTVAMKRTFSIIIRALEGDVPLPDQNIKINGVSYEKTDTTGTIAYHYFNEELNTSISVGIETTEGRSSKMKSIPLGRVMRTIVLQVETIHLYVNCLDTATGETINSLTFLGGDVQASSTNTGGLTKLLFPRLDTYQITITDPTGHYREKQLSLTINDTNNGDTKTIYLDPVAAIDFIIIDAESQGVISYPVIEIDGEPVSGSLRNGRYRYTFDKDDLTTIDVKVSANRYATKHLSIGREFGIHRQNIELENLYAKVVLVSQTGEPAIQVNVKSENEDFGQVGENGVLDLKPDNEGQEYKLTITSENGLYEESMLQFVFDTNGKIIEHILTKQPWVEFRVFQPTNFGNIPIAGVKVTSSTGQIDTTDAMGIFRYRIVDKINQITFNFKKSTYESIELKQYTNRLDEITEVAMPRLEAFFYVRDKRTEIPIPNVSVLVNGNLETLTDDNGRANIFPSQRPMWLNIEVRPQGQEYFGSSESKQYINPNLGIIFLDPRPIKLHFTLRWAGSGLPVSGEMEIVPSHQKYILNSQDKGSHTFEYYEKNLDPKLIITATTPSGKAFKKEVPISLARAINSEIFTPLNIQPKPRITVIVDDGVRLSIYRHTINNSLVAIETGVLGGYDDELPDFGEYTFVRYSGSFVEPDSIYKFITKSNEILDLTRKPHCSEAEALFVNHSWKLFLEKVNEISIQTDCYGTFNKKAAEVCKDELKDYEAALKYYQNITSGETTAIIDGFDPKIDPYIRLNMLEICLLLAKGDQENNSSYLKYYKVGKQQAGEFDKLIQLLQGNGAQAQRKKELLLCRLLIHEFWSTDPRESEGGGNTANAKRYREKLYEETVDNLERYQSKPKMVGFPSLQTELDQLRNTSPWP
ncbi:MAG: hypothetical protein HOM08_12520 [Candidatus Marinimicrobia bacterium]|nr:hypothetical protein [Candidatus Neomarinimicrobiota bacterium]